MRRFTTDLAALLLCWTLPGLVSAKDFSKSTLDLLALLNGDYDNRIQIRNGFTNHALIQFRVVPVDIPILRPDTTWYIEWAADGKVLHMQIGVISERPGNITDITLYNFTDPSLFKPGEFNVSTLSNLKSEELQGHNCTAVFTRLNKSVFFGYWPDCRHSIRRHYPNYVDLFTCKDAAIVLPPTVYETFAMEPYLFKRKGQRYPLVGLPDTYDSICGKRCDS
ncbi:hypothetical protein BsWGS_23093 [Bradybaena similaris]